MIVPGQNTKESPSAANLRPAWRKGQSGNPGGRPKGIASYVRKQTKDGKELVDFMLSILRKSGEFEHGRLDLSVRMDAATWLAERGFGKVPQAHELTGAEGGPVQHQVAVHAVDYRVTVHELRPVDNRDNGDERALPVPA